MYVCMYVERCIEDKYGVRLPHGDALQHHGGGVGHAADDAVRLKLPLDFC